MCQMLFHRPHLGTLCTLEVTTGERPFMNSMLCLPLDCIDVDVVCGLFCVSVPLVNL